MIPYIDDGTYRLHLSKDVVIPIVDFDSSIVLSNLHIDNISVYCTLFADKVKAHTYHYCYDDQIENKKCLAEFDAKRLIFSYTQTPDILGDLVSVQEIALDGYCNLENIVLGPNVKTQYITLSDEGCMELLAPNIIIEDHNGFRDIEYSEQNFNIGTSVQSITISTWCADMLALIKVLSRPGITLSITSNHV